ncbi:MAG: hypothetical protein K6F15_10830 [Treponema sp.]|nr:hypothetical protein [Treponema sp.]
MEKRLFKIIAIFLLVSFCISASFGQENDFLRSIKLHVWAELDAYPGLEEAQDTKSGQWDYSVKRIKEITPFLLEGMIYGWSFSYTPYDKQRNVEEILEINPIKQLSAQDGKIIYEKPWIQDNKIHCWATFDRSENLQWIFKKWTSISSEKAQGYGKGKISSGFDGITEAAKNSLKDAIRSHYRAILKNKPKEICGKVIIRKEPKIGIVEGQYMVELDFFLETDRIIKYSIY